MKWYRIIMTTDEAGDPPYPFVAEEFELFGFDYEELNDGRVVEGWKRDSLIRGVDPDYNGRIDDVLGNAAGFPVFSERLRTALAASNVGTLDIQYLPLRVVRCTGEEIEGFAAANVIARIAALDRERSFLLGVREDKIDPLTGQPKVKHIGKAALTSEVLEGHDVIRLLEFFPPIFVSDRFVKVFNDLRCTGAEFTPLTVS